MYEDTNGGLMLTTEDNPYNPHTDYTQWLYYDTQQGYNTQSYLARVYFSKLEGATTDDIDDLMEETFNEVMKINPLKLNYKLV